MYIFFNQLGRIADGAVVEFYRGERRVKERIVIVVREWWRLLSLLLLIILVKVNDPQQITVVHIVLCEYKYL